MVEVPFPKFQVAEVAPGGAVKLTSNGAQPLVCETPTCEERNCVAQTKKTSRTIFCAGI
jgi:hypothetical protein